MTMQAEQLEEARRLLGNLMGAPYDFDALFAELHEIYREAALKSECSYCGAGPNKECDEDDSRLGSPEDHGGLHVERWEAALPGWIELITEGLDWIIDDPERADRVLYYSDADRLPSDTPAHVREAMLIVLRRLPGTI